MEIVLKGIQAYIKYMKEYVFEKNNEGKHSRYLYLNTNFLLGRLIGADVLGGLKPCVGLKNVLAVLGEEFFIAAISHHDSDIISDSGGGFAMLILKPFGKTLKWYQINVFITMRSQRDLTFIFEYKIITEESAIEFMLLESREKRQTDFVPWFGHYITVVKDYRPGAYKITTECQLTSY